jgi:cytochrome c553
VRDNWSLPALYLHVDLKNTAAAEMYRACVACHQKYLLGTEPPDAPSPADLKLKPLEGRAAPPPNQ